MIDFLNYVLIIVICTLVTDNLYYSCMSVILLAVVETKIMIRKILKDKGENNGN